MRFRFSKLKSESLRHNPKRGIGFEQVHALFTRSFYQDQRSDDPEQYRAIGWVDDRLFTVIFEVRTDDFGEYCHLVTLWHSTREEQELYEASS